ncbi:hypothetical protein FXO37_03065 [Capsicum annuum]|nr:hypothetical protein FXO37_03065 [Capsicum annuum]
MDTKNQMRPSFACVKVEVDLVANLPTRVQINEEDDVTGEIKFKWIHIHYDYKPKYCKTYCLQGHDKISCWNMHPELMEKEDEEKNKDDKEMQETGRVKEVPEVTNT